MSRAAEEKQALFKWGEAIVSQWCLFNHLEPPKVVTHEGQPDFGTCAYYRDGVINIWVNSCASIGRAGMSWSYPGYTVDRTPYGVLAHELGHHVDVAHGPRGGLVAHDWRKETGEAPISGYCPNDNEWFAELFRLYVTNPDLLRLLRPRFYALVSRKWIFTTEERKWDSVIKAERQQKAAWNKIRAASRNHPTGVTV